MGYGFGKNVIEIGSGTSQLSNLIAAASNNRVVAFDALMSPYLWEKNLQKIILIIALSYKVTFLKLLQFY